jgi:hypothetical protein
VPLMICADMVRGGLRLENPDYTGAWRSGRMQRAFPLNM